MNNILDIITARLNEKWIIGYDSLHFYQLIQNYIKQFTELKQSINNPRIIGLPPPDFPPGINLFILF